MISYEDYVAMSAAAAVMGEAAMLAHYRIAPQHWLHIAQTWGAQIASNPQFSQYAAHVQGEQARLRAGGVPKPVALAPPPPMGAPPANYNQQAADFGNEIGKAFDAFGSFVAGAVVGVSIGARVTVAWTDGNRYPGTVTAVQGGQVCVAFPNGQQHWVPQTAVSLV